MIAEGRGVGITEILHESAELPVLISFALITQLGDVWFLFLLGSTLYVSGEELPRLGIDRRRGLFVLAIVFTYVALVGVLKNAFLLPRPHGAGEAPALWLIPSAIDPLFTSITTADGPGFPSGHALGTTMVWGGVALILDQEARRDRLGMAGTVVVLVSLSRLILGVHYAVDVVVGVAFGLVALGVLYWFSDGGTDPHRVLFVAVAVGILGLFMDVSFDSVTALGGAAGGWLTWRTVAETTPAHPSNRRAVLASFVVLGAAAGLFGAIYALRPPLGLAFFGAVITGAGVVGAPDLVERIV